MSRNEKRIRDACKEAKIKVKSLVWEPITRGCEMEGPYGGWLLNEFDPIGYSTDEAIERVREMGQQRQAVG